MMIRRPLSRLVVPRVSGELTELEAKQVKIGRRGVSWLAPA